MKMYAGARSTGPWYGRLLTGTAALAVCLSCNHAAASSVGTSGVELNRSVLPIAPRPFAGVISPDPTQSRPDAMSQVEAPKGAPNVIVVMTDDVGFGASSVFGGPIPTPNLERLASAGLRYTRFHTAGVCSPTRASLLTGRNHHAVGNGELVDSPTAYPGYNGEIPLSAATMGRILGGNGYSTAFFGKHHNVPPIEQTGSGPFTHWPTGLGFDYFFGFIGGEVNQWQPRLYRGTNLVDEVASGPELLDKRLTDDALRWLHTHRAATPDRPFLMYYASGSGHSPHHAPAERIARFQGKFDRGWDWLRETTLRQQKQLGIVPRDTTLAPRPPQVPSWDSLGPEMRRVNARYMEVYAAQLNYFDEQFGRVLDELQRMGILENTLIVFIQGDNGSTAQNGVMPAENAVGAISNRIEQTKSELAARLPLAGGAESYQGFSVGWSYALNTPFPWFKHLASHLGATRNGMVLSWPSKIASRGQIRTTFSHVNDIVPTILEAARIPAPVQVDGTVQQPMDGASLVPSFADPRAETHTTQYFELGGDRSIYHNGWLASTTPVRMPWERGADVKIATPEWAELYDLQRDFGQSRNLAGKYPQRLQELKALWDAEARRNNVYPMDARPHAARGHGGGALRPNAGRTEFVYWGGGISLPQAVAPSLGPQSFTITADLELDSAETTGVILATGSKFGGWAFYVKDGRPAAYLAASQLERDKFLVSAKESLPVGKSQVSFVFKTSGGAFAAGELTIRINGRPVGEGRLDRTIRMPLGLGETFDIGQDTGAPVNNYYTPDRSAGTISKVQVNIERGDADQRQGSAARH